MLALGIICVNDGDDDGTEELSVELEILLIVVVATSIGDEDVVISMEVAYECGLDDDDRYSLEIDALSLALIVFSLVLLETPVVVTETN